MLSAPHRPSLTSSTGPMSALRANVLRTFIASAPVPFPGSAAEVLLSFPPSGGPTPPHRNDGSSAGSAPVPPVRRTHLWPPGQAFLFLMAGRPCRPAGSPRRFASGLALPEVLQKARIDGPYRSRRQKRSPYYGVEPAPGPV